MSAAINIERINWEGDYRRTDRIELVGPHAVEHGIDFLVSALSPEDMIRHAQVIMEHAHGLMFGGTPV